MKISGFICQKRLQVLSKDLQSIQIQQQTNLDGYQIQSKSVIQYLKTIKQNLKQNGQQDVLKTLEELKESIKQIEYGSSNMGYELQKIKDQKQIQTNFNSSDIIQENEVLEKKISKAKNEYDLLQLEFKELNIQLNNQKALKDIVKTKNQELQKRIEEQKNKINQLIDKISELEENVYIKENQLSKFQTQDQQNENKNQDEIIQLRKKIEVYEKELQVYKSSVLKLGYKEVTEQETDFILNDFYDQKEDIDFLEIENDQQIKENIKIKQIQEISLQQTIDSQQEEIQELKSQIHKQKNDVIQTQQNIKELVNQNEILKQKSVFIEKKEMGDLEFKNQIFICCDESRTFSKNGKEVK